MGVSNEQEKVLLKVDGITSDLLCSVVKEEQDSITLKLPVDFEENEIEKGTTIALIRTQHNQTKAKTGTLSSIKNNTVVIKLAMKKQRSTKKNDSSLTGCQLPAMFRSRSVDGFYGCWRGAFIIKHGPDRIHLQVEENQSIPSQTELMFSPIGSETSASANRKSSDDGSVINSTDVRSRRIRVRAITSDVLPSENPGTITLVMDITRTLYRAA